MTTAPLFVLQTYYCERAPHFEVQMAGGDDPDLVRLIFKTDNEAAYLDALDAEGTAQRFIAHWHAERSVRILDALQPAEEYAHV
jgi:hypothetical protein